MYDDCLLMYRYVVQVKVGDMLCVIDYIASHGSKWRCILFPVTAIRSYVRGGILSCMHLYIRQ